MCMCICRIYGKENWLKKVNMDGGEEAQWSGPQESWYFRKWACSRRREVGRSDSGLAGGKVIDLVGLHLKKESIQSACNVNVWLGSQLVLAWQFNSEYLTLHHTAGFSCKQQSASSIAAEACVMLGLGCEAHLKTTHKQEAHLEVLILEKGRWHWLVVSHCKKTLGSPDESSSRLLWTASLSWLVSAVWLRVKLWYATPGICAF